MRTLAYPEKISPQHFNLTIFSLITMPHNIFDQVIDLFAPIRPPSDHGEQPRYSELRVVLLYGM